MVQYYYVFGCAEKRVQSGRCMRTAIRAEAACAKLLIVIADISNLPSVTFS